MKTPTNSRRSLGFTLVELMVTLVMVLFLAFGLIRVFASSNDSYYALSQAAEQIENGRYAVETIKDDLMHAGYYGQYTFLAPASGALPDPCATDAATLLTALPFYIQGYNAPATSDLPSCIAAANYQANTDILVIRRASTIAALADCASATVPTLEAEEIYLQANASTDAANPVLAKGDSGTFTLNSTARLPTKICTSELAEIRKYIVRIYFVSPCSVPASGATNCTAAADGGRPIPTLKRLSLEVVAGVRTMRMESIAEGIENLQVDYGVDDAPPLPGAPLDGLADNFVTIPAAVANWSDVTEAQIHVLARNVRPTAGYTDTKTYTLGLAGNVTPGGNFRRHAFSAHVRLVNPAGRREVP